MTPLPRASSVPAARLFQTAPRYIRIVPSPVQLALPSLSSVPPPSHLVSVPLMVRPPLVRRRKLPSRPPPVQVVGPVTVNVPVPPSSPPPSSTRAAVVASPLKLTTPLLTCVV